MVVSAASSSAGPIPSGRMVPIIVAISSSSYGPGWPARIVHMVDLVLLHLVRAPLVLLPEHHGRVHRLEEHLLLVGGHLVDSVVGEEHDGAGDPKGDGGRDDGVHFVHHENAPVRVLLPE